MNEIVKYHNELNEVRLSNFAQTDLDMFMMLCAKMKERGTEELSFTFAELKPVLSPSNRTDEEFQRDLDRMQVKLGSMTVKLRTETKRTVFNLFPTLEADLSKRILTVSVNPKFAYLLNEVQKNFTAFELKEFVSLQSKYSKSLYRLLKQYRSTGSYKISAEDLRRLLDCPEGYEPKFFARDCLKPAVEELSSCFADLKVDPIRGSGRGRPIQEYRFTFKPVRREQAGKDPSIPPKQKPRQRKNSFNNFSQRNYDFAEYERLVLTGGKEEST